MSEIKRNPIPDEWMDEELQGLGVKFIDRTQEAKEAPAAEVAENDVLTNEGIIHHNRRCRAVQMLTNVTGLVAADGLLIFMCLQDKIELAYGLVFLAVASAFFGGRVKYAGL